MNLDSISKELEAVLETSVVSIRPVGGGSIASSYFVKCASGDEYFAKFYTEASLENICEIEALGLNSLRACPMIRVPRVIADSRTFILLEWIKAAQPNAGFWKSFGEAFAGLHRLQNEFYGESYDNYIGRTPQKNTPALEHKDKYTWPEFYWNYRLQFQYQLLVENQLVDDKFTGLWSKLKDVLFEKLSAAEEAPCLLHGDLWSGNFIATQDQRPCLIDPAVYYGHREADLAMTKLFGGFDPNFYKSYEQAYPLAKGADERAPFYLLYHLMNHMNLFGSSYYSQTYQTLRDCI